MIRVLLLGIAVFVFSFFVTAGVIHAQTETPSPTPATGANSTTPGAPNTGFGY